MEERYIQVGQRWRNPADGAVVELGMPEISEEAGWWARHADGRVELLTEDQVDTIAAEWELVSSLEPGVWERRRPGSKFYEAP